MSKYGWKGPTIVRDKRSAEIRDFENNPENQLARHRWAQVQKSKRESRFTDGPVFKKINTPKLTFFQRHQDKIVGFCLVGCAYFFAIRPIYGLFFEPMTHGLKAKIVGEEAPKLGTKDPEQVLREAIYDDYQTKNGIPMTKHFDKENQ